MARMLRWNHRPFAGAGDQCPPVEGLAVVMVFAQRIALVDARVLRLAVRVGSDVGEPEGTARPVA